MCLSIKSCYLFVTFFGCAKHEKTLTGLDRHGPGDLLGLVRTQELPRVGPERAAERLGSIQMLISFHIFPVRYYVLWDKIDTEQMVATVRELSSQAHKATKSLKLLTYVGCPFAICPCSSLLHCASHIGLDEFSANGLLICWKEICQVVKAELTVDPIHEEDAPKPETGKLRLELKWIDLSPKWQDAFQEPIIEAIKIYFQHEAIAPVYTRMTSWM